jgi:hypothetical protein
MGEADRISVKSQKSSDIECTIGCIESGCKITAGPCHIHKDKKKDSAKSLTPRKRAACGAALIILCYAFFEMTKMIFMDKVFLDNISSSIKTIMSNHIKDFANSQMHSNNLTYNNNTYERNY